MFKDMEIGELLEENTDTINEKDLNSKEEVLMDTKDSFSNGLFLTKNDIDPYDSFSLLKKKEVKILKEFFIHHYDDLERFTFSEFKTLLDENGLSKLLTNTKFIKIANLFLEDIDDEPLDICYFASKNIKILNSSGYYLIKDLKDVNYVDALSLSGLDSKFFYSLIEAIQTAFKKDISHNQFILENNLVKDLIKNKVYENRSIDKIGLSFVCVELLKRNNINNLFDLLNTEYSTFLYLDGFGEIKFKAIIESTLKFLNNKDNEFNLESSVTNFLKQKAEGSTLEEIKEVVNQEDIDSLIENLLKSNKITILNEKYFYKYDYLNLESFDDYLTTLKDSRDKKIVLERYYGKTLEEVSLLFNVTRERVRQIIKTFFERKVKDTTGPLTFKEDKYKYLYENYELTKSQFMAIFNDLNLYCYLQMRYIHGNKDLQEIEEDIFIDPDIKKVWLTFSLKGYVLMNGEYIIKRKGLLVKHYLKMINVNIKHSNLINEFNEFIKKVIPEETEQFFIDSEFVRTLAFRLDPEIISKYPSTLRYYDFYSYDFKELLDTLDFTPYNNMEISSKLLFDNYPSLMKEYGIEEPYDLHFILKCLSQKNPISDLKVVFGRNPIIKIGETNRKEYVLKKWRENDYKTLGELSRDISNETGIAYNVILADWVGVCNNEINGIKRSSLNDEERSYLRERLVNDCYFINEVYEIAGLFSDELANKLDKINLESVGYNFYTGIIIKKPNNLSSFLVKKFTEHDFFDKSEVRQYYLSSTYEMIFYDLINNLEIIEYEHNKFINIRKLEEAGFDKERLSTLQKEVCSLGENYDYFTIYKLKKEGAHFDIDELGYGDNLISSIVKVSKLLSYASFDNVIIFSKSRFTLGDFIKYIVKGFGDISLSELVNYLLKEYGILTSASKIRGFLRGTDIYIDSSGILYDSYKTYVENLKQEV